MLPWLLVSVVLAQPPTDDAWEKYEAPARALLEELAGGQFDKAEARFSPQMKRAVPAAELARVMGSLRNQWGTFQRIASHQQLPDKRFTTFELDVKFKESPLLLQVTVSFDAEGKIAGLRLVPTERTSPADKMTTNKDSQPLPFGDYQTKTSLALPFSGTWLVANGGRNKQQNHHVGNRNQMFASDFVVTGDNQLTYRGDGKKNEDYYAYGQPVLAPAAGRIVQVVDGVEDNVPGETNPYMIPGNLVVIDHGNREYSFLAHFLPGSMEVHVGDQVRRGQRLGRCGNSGNSTEPHIHYHLANAPLMHQGDGLPAKFRQLNVNDKPSDNVEPVQGDQVSNRVEK